MVAVANASRLFLALAFGLAGIAKMRDVGSWRDSLSAFHLPPHAAQAAVWAIPIAELAAALLLVFSYTARAGAAAAIAILSIFTVGVGRSLLNGDHPTCHCFGQLSSRPIGVSTLARNAVMLALAGLALAYPP